MNTITDKEREFIDECPIGLCEACEELGELKDGFCETCYEEDI